MLLGFANHISPLTSTATEPLVSSAPKSTFDPILVELGRGVFAYVSPEPRFGQSNVGVVIDGDGLTFIDTSATPAQASVAVSAALELTRGLGLPIKRVVLTSSRVAFTGGSSVLWSAAFYGSEPTSAALDQPSNPDAFRRLLPHLADAYHDEFTTRPVTHVVSEASALTPSLSVIPLGGESPQNLAVYVESADVVFAGALASFGVTPLCYDGYPAEWANSVESLAGLASTIVPGHGPPGGAIDAAELAAYLRDCATGRADAEPRPEWTDHRFHAVNTERGKRLSQGSDEIPAAMFELLGLQGPG